MLLVDGAHLSCCRRQNLINKDEDGLLGTELNALAYDIHKLAHGEIGWHQVLLLVDGCDVRLLDLLTDDLYIMNQRLNHGEPFATATYRDPVSVLAADPLCFGFALLKRMLVLELGAHGGGGLGLY